MKKTYLAGLAALAFAGNVMADVAIGDDETGVINFSGTVVAGACNVSPRVDSVDVTEVKLDTIASTTMDTANKAYKETNFSIALTGCTATEMGITLKLSATDYIDEGAGVFQAAYAGYDENKTMGFQIQGGLDGDTLGVLNWTEGLTVLPSDEGFSDDGEYEFPMSVAYYPTEPTPAAGVVSATVNYTVSYQ